MGYLCLQVSRDGVGFIPTEYRFARLRAAGTTRLRMSFISITAPSESSSYSGFIKICSFKLQAMYLLKTKTQQRTEDADFFDIRRNCGYN